MNALKGELYGNLQYDFITRTGKLAFHYDFVRETVNGISSEILNTLKEHYLNLLTVWRGFEAISDGC